MSVSRHQVLGAYRNLLKAQKQTFKGDWATLAALKLNEEHELGDNETLRQASKLRRLKNQQAGGQLSTGGGCGSPSCCSGH
ncbi:hypothetical protein BGZ91_000166 [Linnemannia elongata]|nr:hypothetical protein BGZ91_000166 [Linnemannia elongata]